MLDLELPDIHDFVLEYRADECMSEYLSICEAGGRNPVVDSQVTEEEIIKAIEGRKYVGIYYQDDEDGVVVEPGFRLIEPYVYGKGYNNRGKILYPDRQYLRAYVIRSTANTSDIDWKKRTGRKSASKTERTPYWRLFRIDRIKQWKSMPYKFNSFRELYNPDDKKIGEIIMAAPKDAFRYEQQIKLPRKLRNKVNKKKD